MKRTFQARFELLKPRVMGLAMLSAAVGMLATPANSMSWGMHAVALVLIALGAGASSCFNMWWEWERDSFMERTRARPLPSGVVSPIQAIVLACGLASVSLFGLWRFSNCQAVWWMACAMLDYVVIYTIFCKPRTDQSVIFGGIAGALSPLIGEAIVCGHTTAESWLIGALIFFWTPAHFWAFALFGWRDSVAAGFPVLPHTRGGQHTRRDILYYSFAATVVSLVPWWMGQCRFIYGFGAVWLGCIWMARAWQLYLHKRSPRSFFVFSVTYLVSLLVLRVVDLFVLAYRW